MGAYHNALREEGSRSDLMTALETAWTELEDLKVDMAQYLKHNSALATENKRLIDGLRIARGAGSERISKGSENE